jgi:hypothetical protein
MSHEAWELSRRAVLELAAGAMLVPAFLRASRAQNQPPVGESDPQKVSEQDRRHQRWTRVIKDYRVVAHTDPETVLELKAEPILRWSNPIKGGSGLVFLWTAEGRPRAVVCFYRSFWEGAWRESQEFHSLSEDTVTATRENKTVWGTQSAGITWQPVPGAAPPAATPAERLRQLRGLAREFHVVMMNLDKSRTDLRLLTQPVYRYEAKTDGAVFAFVLTTDPDAWLLIEERSKGDAPAWHFAFARMNSLGLIARHHNRDVWEAAWDPEYRIRSKPYFVLAAPAPVPEP